MEIEINNCESEKKFVNLKQEKPLHLEKADVQNRRQVVLQTKDNPGLETISFDLEKIYIYLRLPLYTPL